ncbi:MAG: cation diffusion facilitator family transporter [Polyangiaceae bacterium]|nr:cation diffusion facilitator family transporter [Polyangiaceae bacterium]
MTHSHTHDSEERERKQARRLLAVLVLIALSFVFELVGAKAARSDALEADAFHLLMDVFAIGISLMAMRVASMRPSDRFTFGLRRAESMAALVNGVIVVGVAIELVRDAVRDLLSSEAAPQSGIMLIVASVALIVNGASAWLLHGVMGRAHDHPHDHAHGAHDHPHAHGQEEEYRAGPHGHHLNLRGAWLHLVGDALGSLAAFGAGLAIRMGAPALVDPLAAFVVVAILLVGATRLLRDASMVLLEAAPMRLDVLKVKKTIVSLPGITSLHALHVWSLGTGHDAVTVHVVTDGSQPGLATELGELIRERFHVEYVTVQVDVEALDNLKVA